MARRIDIDNLGPDDLEYFNQRPWLKDEYERQFGKSFDDLDFGVKEQSSEGDGDNGSDENDISGYTRDDFPSYTDKPRPEGWANFSDEEKRDYIYSDYSPVKNDSDIEVTSGGDSDEDEEDALPYDEWEYGDLKAEVADRKLDVVDQKAATLIAALEADDADSDEA